MSPYPDAWTAVRGRPWRFLLSRWPWRAVAYLASAVPVGLAALVVMGAQLVVGAVTAVVVVGLVVLAALPFVATVIAMVERVRLRLVLPATPGRAATSLRDRLRAARDVPVAWTELGYGVALATVVWVVDALVLLVFVTVPVVLLLAPVLVRRDPIGIFQWEVDTAAEAWLSVAAGVACLVLSAYAITGVACAQAAVARTLLEPPEARLSRAVAELRRSRVDLVDAFGAERRRIERDLHDGVQQRLVALTMTLGAAELEAPEGPVLRAIRSAHRQAEEALEDLRTTVRGIHPQVLVDHGLAAAVHEVADRSVVPVTVDLHLDERLPPPVEAAAYFVVSEALTNVARHARARSAQVHGWVEAGRLVVSVLDDGVGGAATSAGSGLRGLALRADALDGSLQVSSPSGGPTEVRFECPTEAP